MKIYINWRREKVAKTAKEAINFTIAKGICDNFSEFLTSEFKLSVKEFSALGKEEKEKIRYEYRVLLAEVLQECWTAIEI